MKRDHPGEKNQTNKLGKEGKEEGEGEGERWGREERSKKGERGMILEKIHYINERIKEGGEILLNPIGRWAQNSSFASGPAFLLQRRNIYYSVSCKLWQNYRDYLSVYQQIIMRISERSKIIQKNSNNVWVMSYKRTWEKSTYINLKDDTIFH